MNYLYRTLILIVLPVVFLCAQSVSPMAIRQGAGGNCKLEVGGSAWVTSNTIQGGGITVRDLSGRGIRAASGVIRFRFGDGRYSDHSWRHEALGNPSISARLTPKEGVFDLGLSAPSKAEGIVLGAYFADGSVCGETGKSVKSHYEASIESARKDADEALKLASSMPAEKFGNAVKAGLLQGGPYARETIDSSNSRIRAMVLGTDGKLLREYRQLIEKWQFTLRPATPAHQTRSSLSPGQ